MFHFHGFDDHECLTFRYGLAAADEHLDHAARQGRNQPARGILFFRDGRFFELQPVTAATREDGKLDGAARDRGAAVPSTKFHVDGTILRMTRGRRHAAATGQVEQITAIAIVRHDLLALARVHEYKSMVIVFVQTPAMARVPGRIRVAGTRCDRGGLAIHAQGFAQCRYRQDLVGRRHRLGKKRRPVPLDQAGVEGPRIAIRVGEIRTGGHCAQEGKIGGDARYLVLA